MDSIAEADALAHRFEYSGRTAQGGRGELGGVAGVRSRRDRRELVAVTFAEERLGLQIMNAEVSVLGLRVCDVM